jgi:hypothetical protein
MQHCEHCDHHQTHFVAARYHPSGFRWPPRSRLPRTCPLSSAGPALNGSRIHRHNVAIGPRDHHTPPPQMTQMSHQLHKDGPGRGGRPRAQRTSFISGLGCDQGPGVETRSLGTNRAFSTAANQSSLRLSTFPLEVQPSPLAFTIPKRGTSFE